MFVYIILNTLQI